MEPPFLQNSGKLKGPPALNRGLTAARTRPFPPMVLPLQRLLQLAAGIALGAPVVAQSLVFDINTEEPLVQPSSGPDDLFRQGEVVLFAATDGAHGRELWSLDSLGNPALLVDLQPGVQSSNPTSFTGLPDGRVLFVASGPGTGFEPWVTDGTVAGTSLIADLHPGAAGSAPQHFAQLGSQLYFFADDGVLGTELWRTDGTPAGTHNVLDTIPGPDGVGIFELPPLVSNSNTLLYAAFSSALGSWSVWSSDGTAQGTAPIATLDNGSFETPRDWVALGDQFLFPARDALVGLELWSSDGTSAGTGPLVDLLPGADSNPEHLLVVGDRVFFAADSGALGVELFASDGTPGGTALVTDLTPGQPAASANPIPIAELNGELFFLTAPPGTGAEPWITDGTPAGTTLLADITPLPDGSLDRLGPGDTAVFAGELYFAASSPVTGVELWKTSGEPSGTQLVADLNPGAIGSDPTGMLALDDQVLFAANAGDVGLELYRTDGTPAGSNLLGDLFTGAISAGSNPENLVRADQQVFFTATDPNFGRELWVTDATNRGTRRVVDLAPGVGDSNPAGLTQLGDRLFFFAGGDSFGSEPRITDGTEAGTLLLGDLSPGPASTFPMGSANIPFDNRVYFSAITLGGAQLWRTDGTPGGTEVFLESSTSPFGLFVGEGVPFQGDLVLRLNLPEDGAGTELYRTSGVPGDLQQITDLAPGPTSGLPFPTELIELGGYLYFQGQDGNSGRELFRTDGTQAGTSLVADLIPGGGSSNPRDLQTLGGRLLFLAQDAGGLFQPFSTDGTPGGTVQLTPLSGGAQPGGLGANGEFGFFREQDPDGSIRLWRTDGLPGGTVVLEDLAPAGSISSTGFGFCQPATSPQLLFPNNNGLVGAELWLTDGSEANTALALDINPGAASSFPSAPVRLGPCLLFSADDGLHGRELFSVPLPTLDMWVAEPFGSSCGEVSLSLEIDGTPVGGTPFSFSITSSEPGAAGFIAITTTRGQVPFGDGCNTAIAGTVLSLLPFVTSFRGESTLQATGSAALAGIPFLTQSFAANTRGDVFSSSGLELILAP